MLNPGTMHKDHCKLESQHHDPGLIRWPRARLKVLVGLVLSRGPPKIPSGRCSTKHLQEGNYYAKNPVTLSRSRSWKDGVGGQRSRVSSPVRHIQCRPKIPIVYISSTNLCIFHVSLSPVSIVWFTFGHTWFAAVRHVL